MAKTLAQLRSELSARLGFGTQDGAEIIQKPLLDSILQRSQETILSEFGSALPGTIWPAASFTADGDSPSVPEEPLMYKALALAQAHYRQPTTEVAAAEWQNWEANVRGFSS